MTDDRNLSKSDVQSLTSRDSVAAFFAGLGYQTDSRQPQSASAMGITATSLLRQVKHIERIAVQDDGAEPLDLYLVELTSVTVAATQGLTRALRNRVGNYLLVLTDDYERLDFVLLQRSLPSSTASPMTTRQVTVRPRILTVNRRDPSQVQLRVLRRFSYTEVDSDSQYDKLLSAYAIADWSEPLFNNRALFSDYYLNERLPELPEWKERPEEIYHRLRELLARSRRQASESGNGMSAQMTVEPVLEALGFEPLKTTRRGSPDYQMYGPEKTDGPVAVCLAYAWNRYLDGRDETRDGQNPDENPGARVVTVLESSDAMWAIVTNGKLWRLYSSRTHSRSTNYYEIDLEETLATLDANVAFRYFWLFFRFQAFVAQEVHGEGQSKSLSFLDRLLEESENYAKGLGERLKERVFERVFPYFAAGFIEHLKGQVGLAGPHQTALLAISQQLRLKREPDEDFRRQVFNGTLTLLYRLLFLLYAESRDLLPVKEVRGYREQSLTKLREDIAEKAGSIEDEVPGRLQKFYGTSTGSTDMYDRLLGLFSVIDQGRSNLNVPLYNGGLFTTNAKDGDHSQQAETARFLAKHKIPDRYLAFGLDLLARDVDDKRQDLVFIDYKSLGVRQLGSIYEGLLEFKVRVAPEKMAVVKGKNTEEIIPHQEAVKSNRKVLTVGRGRNTNERVYQLGEVYLENDRRERKASGSYYTPDHIVRYIVKNAVGPVLAEKFEKLRPRFREAGQRYRQRVRQANSLKKQGQVPDDPAKIANTYEGLVDDMFDLRVLDPAMGSGHFLVEAVDFICDRILGEREGFLRGFPWNPVTRYLQGTREAIITEMERQGIAVDTGRLTDINLLKRHVLKRCAYGVDLNPMAVELAKVSLWLDCFTIGAPLSFLDHHLKCGNSLIGTTVQEVEAEMTTQEKETLSLFGGPFQGMLAATASIESLRRIPDATVAQAEQSHTLYADFEKAQAPYKAALDIWVSQHFDNKLAKEYLTLAGSGLVDQIRSDGKGLSKGYRDTIVQGGEIGREKRFFHWDLEFPEAFVDLDGGRWKPKEEQGFDAVLGNPPYDVLASEELGYDVSPFVRYFRSNPKFAPAIKGKLNLYKLFICQAALLPALQGNFSFIVPMGLLGDDATQGIRRLLLEEKQLVAIESFPQKDDPRRRVFEEAKLPCTVFVARSESGDAPITIRSHLAQFMDPSSDRLSVRPTEILALETENVPIPSCTQRDWHIAVKLGSHRQMGRLGDHCRAFQGEVNETTDGKKGFISKDPATGPQVLRGSNLGLYTVRAASQGTAMFLNRDKFLAGKPASVKRNHHQTSRVGWQESSAQNNFRRIIAAMIPEGQFCNHKINYFPKEESSIALDLLLALLNSKISDWYFRLISTNAAVSHYQLYALPVPTIVEMDGSEDWIAKFEQGQWDEIAEQLIGACKVPAELPKQVALAIEMMSRTLRDIESSRTLTNRSERSRLASESQPIQDAIDKVLFHCYGLSEDDALYIERRLSEML